jgi:hypothetical protein
VACKWHLALDVIPETGTLKVNFSLDELETIPDTCALDVADRGGCTLDEVGQRVNVTRERIRQIESKMLVKLYRRFKAAGVDGADGFLHIQHALGAAQEEGTTGGAFRKVSAAAGDYNREFKVKRAARAAELEKTREQRVAEHGEKIQAQVSEQARLIREQKAVKAAEMQREMNMRASKMDGLEGAAAQAVKEALVDRDIGTKALMETLEELGAVEEHELTESGVGYYLRTRRAAIDAGEMEEPEIEEDAEALVPASESPQELPDPDGPRLPTMGTVPPSQGYVVLPGGEIWTGSADAAVELQKRIISGRAKGG